MAELLAPFLPDERRLNSGAVAQLSSYLDLLLRWNARMNLTAVRDPEQIVTRHFGESLFAAWQLFPAQSPAANCRLIDVGSGAGFPGVPIKICAPQLSVTLIESRQRKATFLREVVRTLALTDVTVFCGRAEEFPGAPADVVTLRAVERFEDALPTAARLVAPGGRLALLIGSAQVARAREVAAEFSWGDTVPIPQSAARVVLVGAKPE